MPNRLKRISSAAMASSPKRRAAWILLLAALSQPGWALAHALLHEHLAHHHAEPAATSYEAAASVLGSDERPHDHGHLDGALLLFSRSSNPASFAALPSPSPSPGATTTRSAWVVPVGAPPRASPELADPSRPRAPPHA